jgi:plasmid stability protein
MKNLTLAVPEDTLQRFRVHAANKNTTVNALIRQFMEDEVGGEARRKAAIARMLSLGGAEPGITPAQPVDSGSRITTREETYAERLNRWPKA